MAVLLLEMAQPHAQIMPAQRFCTTRHGSYHTIMSKALYDEIDKLDLLERLRLAQAILDSIASEMNAPPLTDEQRAELRARLEHYRRHPDEPTSTLDEIKSELGLR
jgi:putative addiction module component (TIGR02574 family)